MSSTWKYRHNSFASARKRKQRKSKSKSNKMFSSPDKKRLFDTARGSWYEHYKKFPKLHGRHLLLILPQCLPGRCLECNLKHKLDIHNGHFLAQLLFLTIPSPKRNKNNI